MILQFEQALQAKDARVVLPFWDWTRADSRDLDAEPWKSFFGGRNNTGGKFDHWNYTRAASPAPGRVLPSLDNVIDELQSTTFANFRAMEFGTHVPGHTWTGGTMQGTSSPLDPLFISTTATSTGSGRFGNAITRRGAIPSMIAAVATASTPPLCH
jgi:hypothetical protein